MPAPASGEYAQEFLVISQQTQIIFTLAWNRGWLQHQQPGPVPAGSARRTGSPQRAPGNIEPQQIDVNAFKASKARKTALSKQKPVCDDAPPDSTRQEPQKTSTLVK
ncbi:hypothetical protein [uncultured Pigmentiphaga sp.]|uniref:hypothetical protein n=1 Tax=uncultured Pigmentiphaga sp. TaxID=340361 RepID=UPI002608B983|nr:hypothetical protein [uncultured Pigmentiphaga sp.]